MDFRERLITKVPVNINQFYNVSSDTIRHAAQSTNAYRRAEAAEKSKDLFSNVLNNALENVYTTNSYISDMENEEVKLALGVTENTHDLTIAMQKASEALQYTVAVRDKFLEAYKEIMQMQI